MGWVFPTRLLVEDNKILEVSISNIEIGIYIGKSIKSLQESRKFPNHTRRANRNSERRMHMETTFT